MPVTCQLSEISATGEGQVVINNLTFEIFKNLLYCVLKIQWHWQSFSSEWFIKIILMPTLTKI